MVVQSKYPYDCVVAVLPQVSKPFTTRRSPRQRIPARQATPAPRPFRHRSPPNGLGSMPRLPRWPPLADPGSGQSAAVSCVRYSDRTRSSTCPHPSPPNKEFLSPFVRTLFQVGVSRLGLHPPSLGYVQDKRVYV